MDSNRRWSVLVMVAVLSGCASMPEESAHLDRSYDPVEIADVPFFAQEQYQCGPAALATALVHSGAKTSASELVSEVYVPGRQGSLQPELLAAARAADRIPYVIDTSVSAIYAELLTGRPVLVLQNLGIKQLPRWHYAVVIGIDPGLGKVYLRSGTDRRRETDLNTFLRTWQRSNFWAFAVLQPGELPAQPDAMRYAEAVAAAQASGHEQAAQLMYRHFGFAPVGVRKNYYAETGEDALVMWVHEIDGPEYLELLQGLESNLAGETVFDTGR
jgi:hypothetical protein